MELKHSCSSRNWGLECILWIHEQLSREKELLCAREMVASRRAGTFVTTEGRVNGAVAVLSNQIRRKIGLLGQESVHGDTCKPLNLQSQNTHGGRCDENSFALFFKASGWFQIGYRSPHNCSMDDWAEIKCCGGCRSILLDCIFGTKKYPAWPTIQQANEKREASGNWVLWLLGKLGYLTQNKCVLQHGQGILSSISRLWTFSFAKLSLCGWNMANSDKFSQS